MSDFGIFCYGTGFGLIVALMLWLFINNSNTEPSKPRKILIKYKDGNKEECIATDWERYDDHITIYNNDLEDNLVKELSADCVKSIGFAKGRVSTP